MLQSDRIVKVSMFLFALFTLFLPSPAAASIFYDYVPTSDGNASGHIEISDSYAGEQFVWVNYTEFLSFSFIVPELTIEFGNDNLCDGGISANDFGTELSGGNLWAEFPSGNSLISLNISFAASHVGQRDGWTVEMDLTTKLADGYGDWVLREVEPVPIPSSFLLLLSSLAGGAVFRAKRNQC